MAKEMILFVDDDDVYLNFLVDKFRAIFGSKYLYEKVGTAEEAEDVISDELSTSGILPSLMVVDWMMPGKKGDQLIRDMNSLYPEIPLVLHSGMLDNQMEKKLESQVALVCSIGKPWDGETHIDKIKAALQT